MSNWNCMVSVDRQTVIIQVGIWPGVILAHGKCASWSLITSNGQDLKCKTKLKDIPSLPNPALKWTVIQLGFSNKNGNTTFCNTLGFCFFLAVSKSRFDQALFVKSDKITSQSYMIASIRFSSEEQNFWETKFRFILHILARMNFLMYKIHRSYAWFFFRNHRYQ